MTEENITNSAMEAMEDLERSTSELDVSEEGPSGERWEPVGANNGDDDYISFENKPKNKMDGDFERLQILEEEQEILNSSLISLTTHFAQVQFRLKQICDAPTDKKAELLKELEEFAFRGIPDIKSNLLLNPSFSSTPTHRYDAGSLEDVDGEEKMKMQKQKQKELIQQLKSQLEDLEQYAYETGDADLPQSIMLERQNLIISHLKEKLNFNVEDLSKLSGDDLKWQVDFAINQIVSPLKMKEQLITQLKTQITDLERFINYLQGEISPETLACTCACPVHTNFSNNTSRKRNFRTVTGEDNTSSSLSTVQKIVGLLHAYLLSQVVCGSQQVGSKKNDGKYGWRDLRTRLDIAVEHVLETVIETSEFSLPDKPSISNPAAKVGACYSESDSAVYQHDSRVTTAVRKHLAVCIRDLMQHGTSSNIHTTSLVPFASCFPKRSSFTNTYIHAWEIILKYYEIKNGHMYISSPAHKLSQSFNIDLNNCNPTSNNKSLLVAVGNINATHAPYKRSHDTCFKAFICAGLNANKLVIWLRLILKCQYLLENYYMPWSYVVKTGFRDAFHTLDRLTKHKFDLPVNLAVQQFQNIKEAF